MPNVYLCYAIPARPGRKVRPVVAFVVRCVEDRDAAACEVYNPQDIEASSGTEARRIYRARYPDVVSPPVA